MAWGNNSHGQTEVAINLSNVVAVAAGQNHSLAVRANGTVVGWGDNSYNQSGIPAMLSNVTAIAAGVFHSLALQNDGRVIAWGDNSEGQTSVPANLSNVVAITAGWVHNLALKSDGTVVAWGRNFFNETSVPAGLSNVVAIAGCASRSLALKSDGTVVGWGDGATIPSSLSNVVAIAGCGQVGLALKGDGTLVLLWGGDNGYGQNNIPVGLTNVVAMAGAGDGSNGNYGYSLALKGDNTIAGWGWNDYGQTSLPSGLTNILSIAAGPTHVLALVSSTSRPIALWRPENQTVFSGSDAVLQTGFVGTSPITYRWLFEEMDFAVTSVPRLTITNIQPTSAGQYRVIATNAFGSAHSSNTLLTVSDASPIIIQSPANVLGLQGSNATFSVAVIGSLPMLFQWQFNGTNIGAATNTSLTLPNLQLTNEGIYSVWISNAFGTATSSNAHLNVLDLAEALNSNMVWSSSGAAPWTPQTNHHHDGFAGAASGLIGDSQQSILQTTLTGPATLKFWWAVETQLEDYLIFSVNGVEQQRTSGHHGWRQQTHYLGSGVQILQWTYLKNELFSYGMDQGWLDEVSFVLEGTPPVLTEDLTPRVVLLGSNVTLSASALGTPPLQHQWQLNGTNLPGANSPTLVLTNVTFAQEGVYQLTITNEFGSTNTAEALVNVVDFAEAVNAPELTWTTGGNKPWFVQTTTTHDGVAALRSGAITANQQSTVQTTVSGPGTISFWWNVSCEATNDFVRFQIDGIEQARIFGNPGWQRRTFYLSETNAVLTWTYSKNATINSGTDAAWLDEVIYTPGITPALVVSSPANIVTRLFSNATFQVVAGGTPPLHYQWFFNEQPLSDATNAQLVVTGVQLPHLGHYAVQVTNAYGTALSSNAELQAFNLYAWGTGTNNNGTGQNFNQSVVPANVTNPIAIAAGVMHSLALRPDGRVAAWGWNSSGQTFVPANLTNARAISAGFQHSLALRSNGTVQPWGSGSFSLLSVPSAATNVTAISSGWYHNLALRSNGTVVAWGAGTTIVALPNFGQSRVPTNLTDVLAIAAGGYHSLALRNDGTVVAWGWNASGQTNVPPFLSNVVAIAAGTSNSLALRRDGTVVAWGSNTYGQTNVPVGLSNVVAIAAGAGHHLALRADGSLVAWGWNAYGQTNLPAGISNYTAIAAGGFHNLALINLGPAAFLNQPQFQIVFKGETATFLAAALGQPPLSYQWQFNGIAISGATNQSLVITNAQFSDAGSYRLVVTQPQVAITSTVAQLTVKDPAPNFLLQPTNQFALPNSNVVFTALAGGAPPIFYQWQRNGTNLSGQTSTNLVLPAVTFANEGAYAVVASNAFGVTTSDAVFLNVLDLGEALNATNLVWTTSTNPAWQPQKQVTHDGVAAAGITVTGFGSFGLGSLHTVVVGAGKLSFWWYQNNTLSSMEGMSFYLNGVFQTRLMFFSPWQQQTVYLPVGTNYLEWRFERSISSQTASGYLDEVTFIPGTTPPLINSALANRTGPAGTNVTFTVGATGTPPLAYQWQFAGTNLIGATNASLSLVNIQPANSGSYQVIITNAYGSTNSSAILTVTNSAPVILSASTAKEMVRGGTVIFEVTARGSDPLAYQWQFEETNLPAATNAVLRLSQIQPAHAGNYRVVVTNAFGTAVSTPASLTLVPTVIVGWGSVFTSSPNPPLGLTNVAAISGGDNYSVALRTDGTVHAWGWDAFSRLNVPAGLSDVAQISAGGFHGSTLLTNGTVVNWGDVFFDSSVNVPTDLSNVVAIAAGHRFNLALKRDNTVQAWGENFLGPLNLSPLTNVVALGAGPYHGLALKRDGTVTAWGNYTSGQTNVPPAATNVVAVDAGYTYSMALRQDGSVITWGSGAATNLPNDLTNTIAIAAGWYHGLALREDGIVSAWGQSTSGQTAVPDWLTNVVAISAGSQHSLALLNDGSPYITRQPWTQTIAPGETARFEVVVMGQSPRAFQWHHNHTPLPGATNATLILTNPPLTSAGIYHCVVTNSIGNVTSLPAWLTVTRTVPQFVTAGFGIGGGNTFGLHLAGLSGHGQIILYASSNLVHWEAIHTNAPVVGELLLKDPYASTWPQRFYKIIEE
jgi:alpha-tubulin suppressor-like RCC1 family protein